MKEDFMYRVSKLDDDYILRVFHYGASNKALHSSIHKTAADANKVAKETVARLRKYYGSAIENKEQ